MKIILANPRGFCAGVNMAIETVDKVLAMKGPPVYVYHEIVHNRHVVDGFRKRGVSFVDNIDEVPRGGLVALMLASANRDPAQFPDPGRLDVTRPVASHFSLGYGRNSCVGGNPVRVAIAVATSALVSIFGAMELSSEPEFRTGSGFSFPSAVDVTLLA